MKEKTFERSSEGNWDLEIKPKPHLLDLNFAEIWRYKDLMLLFVKRDFIAQYKQTILGPVWHLIQPILTTLMFLLIFSNIAKIPTDGINPVVFYMSGITVWNYFSLCLTSTSNTFLTNANIFGKVYFPRLIMPLSVIISNMIRFGIQFLLLLSMMIWFHFHGFPMQITFKWLTIPILILLMAGIALGLGIVISSLTTKYRDFSVLLAFAIQLGMYATPIAYPMTYLEGTSYGSIIKLNPLTAVVEAFRYVLFGKGLFNPMDLLYSAGFMIVLLFIGIILFNRVEKKFMDTV
ncbi:ABC transporter permease [Chryseolinea sp. H1M3-3]|uniref:ABC transporter permease n=1 Tax=Chryseolinea sp. H1M3-3 TaxID=3034144 RepID=UPI0023EB9CD5|nr:ABC transporter permease [Chryseolinea sp. H1M3-3]